MNPKELKKLIKTCRELGVKSYKGEGFEFTLTDSEPVKQTKSKSLPSAQESSEQFESDTLTEDHLLFWSTSDTSEQETL